MRMRTEKLKFEEAADYGKRRLLNYADSFRELAGSLRGEFCFESTDRQKYLDARNRWENRQILCENLQEVARIMTRAAAEIFRCRPMEERQRRIIAHALRTEGILVRDLFYIDKPGERTAMGITMCVQKGGSRKARDVADMLSVILGKRLAMSKSSPYQVDETQRSYVVVEEAAFLVMTGAARAVRENESSSGDNYALVETEHGRYTVLLSDGTGSGEKACEDSEKVLDMMEKLIEAGFDPDSAVSLLNSAVMAQGEEESLSTLDVCSLDLYEGLCDFRKAGAAASFVKRDYLVEQIDVPSLPLGVLPLTEPEVVTCELMDGDYVIMMTDGVLDALEQNRYEESMRRVISDLQERNPREMAERLLQFVLHCSGGRILDDMTIVVTGIWENGK